MKGFTHESTQSRSVEWYTPPEIFKALGITFEIDVCSPGEAVVPWIPAKRHLTKSDDGLQNEWKGSVWMNPPYGPLVVRWVDRFILHRYGVALLFARTDTRWFHRLFDASPAFLFLKGRIRFIDSNGKRGGQPGCGSVLVAFGIRHEDALEECGLGAYLPPRE